MNVSSGRAPPATLKISAGTLSPAFQQGTQLLREPVEGRGQVGRGRALDPRGGGHVDDARGHAPTLGQTRKRRRP